MFLLSAPLSALSASVDAPPAAKIEAVTPAGKLPTELALPNPAKVTRWEDTGMKPTEAHEWQNYGFSPNDGMNWRNAGFEPVVARTWSDKGFDPDEAREWRDTARQSRTMMAEMDHADPAAWKKAGFTPLERLAWWDAGFVFDDAVLLARNGMTPAQAAWHGQEKLKELRANGGTAAASPGGARSPASASQAETFSLDHAWRIIAPFVKIAVVALVAILSGGFAFFLYRRAQHKSKLVTAAAANAPDSEFPPESLPAKKVHRKPGEKRKPAREVRLWRSEKPHCIHCKSGNVRRSKMHPHKFGGINFTEYFRCKKCGRHFAIVSYTAIIATAASFLLAVILVTASFVYLFSVA